MGAILLFATAINATNDPPPKKLGDTRHNLPTRIKVSGFPKNKNMDGWYNLAPRYVGDYDYWVIYKQEEGPCSISNFRGTTAWTKWYLVGAYEHLLEYEFLGRGDNDAPLPINTPSEWDNCWDKTIALVTIEDDCKYREWALRKVFDRKVPGVPRIDARGWLCPDVPTAEEKWDFLGEYRQKCTACNGTGVPLKWEPSKKHLKHTGNYTYPKCSGCNGKGEVPKKRRRLGAHASSRTRLIERILREEERARGF